MDRLPVHRGGRNMKRCIVNVATTEQYRKGQDRLMQTSKEQVWYSLPDGCPSHQETPYAFKAYAMMEASKQYDLLLWCDSSIVSVQSLKPLWDRIERDGYWMS